MLSLHRVTTRVTPRTYAYATRAMETRSTNTTSNQYSDSVKLGDHGALAALTTPHVAIASVLTRLGLV
jgi:hypothetical protein